MLSPTPDLTQPSLRGLAYLLRHEELWPVDFRWNYRFRDSCAMGLMSCVWGTLPWASTCSSALGLSTKTGVNLFYDTVPGGRRTSLYHRLVRRSTVPGVTPEDVAMRIDHMLEREAA